MYICGMFTAFENLSPQAKVWVYPCSRKFYPQELDELQQQLQDFCNTWITSEEKEITTSYKLVYNRFVIFSIEEDVETTNEVINKQVAFVIELQQKYKVELLDKMNVCFKQGEHVQYKELKEFKKLLKNKSVSAKTVVFDNLVQTKDELENFWEVPITESWYNRFL